LRSQTCNIIVKSLLLYSCSWSLMTANLFNGKLQAFSCSINVLLVERDV